MKHAEVSVVACMDRVHRDLLIGCIDRMKDASNECGIKPFERCGKRFSNGPKVFSRLRGPCLLIDRVLIA